MSKWFPFMLFCVAVLIAGNAAYFSVKGIGLLFAGSFLPVIIMASSLEIGKLFAVSFLYRKWYDMKFFMKLYLSTASLLLMIITSLGIFGFLSDAYQDTKTKVELYESKITSTQNEIDNINKQLNTILGARDAVDTKTSDTIDTYKKIYEDFESRINTRVDVLNTRLSVLDKQITDLQSESGGLFSSKTSRLKKLKEEQQPEKVSIANEIENLNEQLTVEYQKYLDKIDKLSQDTTSNLSTQQQTEPLYDDIRVKEETISDYKSLISDTDIGSFKFIARSFDVETDTAVKWFILMIVVVFDPLAVCLVLGYNMYVMRTPYDGYTTDDSVEPKEPIFKRVLDSVRGRNPRWGQEGK